jgi:hypothetical protein
MGFGSWHAMKDRCLNKSGREYKRYGAKGIFVCHGLASTFKSFMDIMGDRPSLSHSIDRVNTNGSYTCGVCDECVTNGWILNVRWATPKQQVLNRNPYVTLKRKEKSGIYRVKGYNRWRVSVSFKGKDTHLGQFGSFEEAKSVRDSFIAKCTVV